MSLLDKFEIPNLILGGSLAFLGSYLLYDVAQDVITQDFNEPWQLYVATGTTLLLSYLPFSSGKKRNESATDDNQATSR